VEYQEKRLYQLYTRLINVIVASLGLVLLAPLMSVIALAIKFSDRRAAIFYRGRRVGRGKKIFTILKFRTMESGIEQKIGASLIDKESSFITPLGRLMRSRKLDEIPQLLNVLRGEMNLVGPRPVREVFLQELRERIPGYDRRFLVKPGITGLAQVRGGYYTDPRQKLRYELIYIRGRSIWMDLKLIVATLLIMASRTLTMFCLLFLLLAFLTFVPTTFIPSLRLSLLGLQVNIAYVLIAFLASGWLTQKLYRKELTLLRRTPADKAIVGFILFATLGALLNGNFASNFLGVLYFCSSAFVLYFLAVQIVDHNLVKMRWYLKALGLITVIVSLGGILEYFAGQVAGTEGDRLESLLGNPNVFSLYIAIVLPLLLYLRWTSSQRLAECFWSGSIIAAGTCSFLSASKSGFVALLIAVWVFLFRWQRRLSYSMLLALAGVVFIGEFTGDDRFTIRQIVTSPGSSRIIQEHVAVLSSYHDRMILGVGWRNWKTAVDSVAFHERGLAAPSHSLPQLNSMYMILLAEYGIVGLFFILLIFVTILKAIYDSSYRVKQPSLQVLMWGIFSSTLGFMGNMFLFDSFYFIAVQATFWVLVGLGMGIALEFSPASQRWYRVLQFRH
jgi:lipopolysaccharide/colanic/teichoic acid biosynthesis glycosyltransferase